MIEVAHKEYSKDPNGFEKLLIDVEKPLKEFANATECPECGQSRWKNVKDRNEERKQIPSKVIWYFPPIPRFKRLFRSIECAENLTWHASERIDDGPKQLGDDIGTYLAPLIEDLKLLWENGVECYDAYREEVFNLRSVLLWTINDFPAYGNLNGCCVKGYKAYPICGDNTNSIRLRQGKKIAYLGHRRFLARDHLYRRQKKSFNGKKELGTISEPLSGEDVYLKLKDLESPKGNKIHKNLSMNRSEKICWNMLSSFFELPYWKDLHVRHCLDVMHIKKNVCMNILGTLLDILGKCKDGLNAICDLVDLKLRPELAPISSEKKIFIPPACYTLTKEEKRCVLKTLSRIKVPKGYSSNIRNLVSMTDLKLNSLKSHDCHVLTQQLFPIAIRLVLPKHLRYVITRLCIFFNYVCNKVLDAQQLDKLEEDIVVSTELEVGNSGVSDNLRWIAHGPHPFVITYSGYAINGCRYHTKSSKKDRSVQNSGVSLVAKTMQVSSSKDKNLVI
ncbi:transposase [Cucumis melo var. makuwa]|uniref:Transposase n=1 Tax=Cucumis melo var. makuwa TaxID=1194695 RepID=A0A5A7TUG9_CUCMM|nr:transposase [Cucumis melo var. makuwa]